ncbi:MAG: mechanosensitive ion channel protein MscS [Bacteriovoracaceae bacterium]|nr:mechanosensitive ion channel protein MscS [Bacteriovoracaceae bacterium]
MSLLEPILFGHSIFSWLIALAIFLGFLIVLVLIKRILVRHLAQFVKTDQTDSAYFLINLIDKTKLFFLVTVSAVSATYYLNLSDSIHHFLKSFFIVILLIQVSFWGEAAIKYFLLRLVTQRELKRGQDPSLQTTVSVLQVIAKLILYGVIALLILDNLGFNVTTLIAGLGVGGIAVALAAQNILGDLFASLSIVLDKPFIIGDLIDVNGQKGRVERIGMKTTRIRSTTGEQIIISNTDLLRSKILNFARMTERMVVFTIGVTYQTPPEQLRKIPEILKAVITKQKKVRFDHAHFKGLGESSVNFEVVYYVMSGDYKDYIEVEEAINLEVFELFLEGKIGFAHPTRTLIMEKSE